MVVFCSKCFDTPGFDPLVFEEMIAHESRNPILKAFGILSCWTSLKKFACSTCHQRRMSHFQPVFVLGSVGILIRVIRVGAQGRPRTGLKENKGRCALCKNTHQNVCKSVPVNCSQSFRRRKATAPVKAGRSVQKCKVRFTLTICRQICT